MAVACIYRDPGNMRETYGKLAGQVMEQGKPPGLVLHLAGEDARGQWKILEVWENDGARDRFGQERLFPLFKQHGVDISKAPEPERLEVKNLIT